MRCCLNIANYISIHLRAFFLLFPACNFIIYSLETVRLAVLFPLINYSHDRYRSLILFVIHPHSTSPYTVSSVLFLGTHAFCLPICLNQSNANMLSLLLPMKRTLIVVIVIEQNFFDRRKIGRQTHRNFASNIRICLSFVRSIFYYKLQVCNNNSL